MQVLATVLIFLGLALLAFTSMASAPRIVRMEPSSRAIPSATTVSPASPLPVSAPANEGKPQASGAGAPSEASRSDLSTRSGAVADPTCHARLHTDYMGERAPVWGLGKPGFHLQSAAECCAACQAHNRVCGKPGSSAKAWWPSRPELRCGNNPGCNVWVYCPEKQCFAFDIHVHTQGECWLKQQHANITRPKDPHEGHTSFPAAMARLAARGVAVGRRQEDLAGRHPREGAVDLGRACTGGGAGDQRSRRRSLAQAVVRQARGEVRAMRPVALAPV